MPLNFPDWSSPRIGVLAAGLVLLTSGCADGAGPRSSGGTDLGPIFDDVTGAVTGIVTDDALVPIPDALVRLAGSDQETRTDASGAFSLAYVEPGEVEILVDGTGYKPGSLTVDVRAGQTHEVAVRLLPLPSDEPYHLLQTKNGRILCGAAWRTAPNTNGTRFAACGAMSLFGNPVEVDDYITVFDLNTDNVSTVKSLVFQTEWLATQAFGNGLRIEWQGYVELVGVVPQEPLRNFVVTQGRSPLRALLDDREIAKNVTEVDPPLSYCHAGGPCRLWAQNWAYPSTLGSSSQVDFSFYIDQPFTHYVTEFYGDFAPRDFTAIPDR